MNATLAPAPSERITLRAAKGLFIGGEWVAPSTDNLLTVISPTNEEPIISVAAASVADVDRAVAAARHAFNHGYWPRLTPTERAVYLAKLAEKIRANADRIGSVWPQEMGVLRSIALASVAAAADFMDDYARLAGSFAFEERHTPRRGGAIGLLVREPVGVVGAIIPWNAPLTLLTHKLGPALLAGCCVVVKAAPEAPTIPLMIAEMCEEIGLPPGVVNVLTADREASEHLVQHPGVDKISFTGSSATGRRIASLCGGRMARFTLELGGKSAAIILDDYDIETAARAICGPAVFMSGQACSSLTRIVVSRGRHDRMVDALSDCFASVKLGDPLEPETGMGPVAMQRQRDRIEDLMLRGRSEGAVLACGGGRAGRERGFFIEPTVFGHVGNDTILAREEIFGPVLSVIAADDEEQAVEIANDTVYGLNNSVFTGDADRAYGIARRLRSGTVGHNGWRTDFSLSFGGFKQSGIGREGILEGLLPYLESKSIILDGVPMHLT